MSENTEKDLLLRLWVLLYTKIYWTYSIAGTVLSFLWTRQKEGQTVGKRILVSKKRVSASFGMGGLQIPDPETTIQGTQINLLQKIFTQKSQ